MLALSWVEPPLHLHLRTMWERTVWLNECLTIDPSGARAASLAENRDTLNARQREAYGGDLALSPQTPQAQWSGISALGLTEVGEEGVRAALYGSSPDHAPDKHLDAHGGLLDIRRRVATRSRVTAVLTGVAGIGVVAGSLAKTSTGGDQFRTLDDVVLSPTGVTVDMEAVEEGPITARAGTLTEIVTVLAGWETINNTFAASVGIDREQDEAYRASMYVRTAHSSVGPLAALRAALEEALAGKTKAVENRTKAPIVVQEFTLDPNSLLVVAQAGSDGDVLRSVENHRGMGAGTMAAIRGGAADETALAAISNGTVTWGGVDYTGLDLTGTSTPAERATVLTLLLVLAEVVVSYIDGAYVTIFAWTPDATPNFAQASTEVAFGLDPAASSYPAGPFIRAREKALDRHHDLDAAPRLPCRRAWSASATTCLRVWQSMRWARSCGRTTCFARRSGWQARALRR